MATQQDHLDTIVRLVGAGPYMSRVTAISGRLNMAAKAQDAWNAKMQGWTRIAQGADRAANRMLFAGGAIVGLMATMVKQASDVEEQMNLFREVFKDSAEDVEAWADTFADVTGRTKYELMGFAGQFQALLVPMGLGREEAAELSKKLGELVVDVASFRNLTQQDVAGKLVSGLAGMHRALYDLGIVISQDQIQIELLRMGIEKSWQEVSAAEKVQARYNIIMDRTVDAQGDAERTAGSLENRMRRLTSEYTEMAVTIGEHLKPAAQDLNAAAIELLDTFNDLPPWLQKIISLMAGGGGLVVLFGGLALKLAATVAQLLLVIPQAKIYNKLLWEEAAAAGAAATAEGALATARTAAAAAGVAAGVGGAAAVAGAAATLALPAAAAGVAGAAGVTGGVGAGMVGAMGVGGALGAFTLAILVEWIVTGKDPFEVWKGLKEETEKAAEAEKQAMEIAAGFTWGKKAEAIAEVTEATQQWGVTLAEVNDVVEAVKKGYDELIDRQRKWARGLTGAAAAQTDVARAEVELLEARGVGGIRMMRAKRYLAGMERREAATQLGVARQARWLAPTERARYYAGALRAQAGAIQTYRGSGGPIMIKVEGQAAQAFRWNAFLQDTQSGQYIRATAGTTGYPG